MSYAMRMFENTNIGEFFTKNGIAIQCSSEYSIGKCNVVSVWIAVDISCDNRLCA